MDWRNKNPTEKQLDFIEDLEKDYGVKFTGDTRGEASDFISECVERFRLDLRNFNWKSEIQNG